MEQRGKPAQGVKEGITHEHLPYPLWESRGQHGVWIPMILPSKGSVLPLTKCSLLFRDVGKNLDKEVAR